MGLAGALALATHSCVLLALATHSCVLLGLASRLVLVVMSHFILRHKIIFTHQEGALSGLSSYSDLVTVSVFRPPNCPESQNQSLGTGVGAEADSDATRFAQR